jgi:hypothetical protein
MNKILILFTSLFFCFSCSQKVETMVMEVPAIRASQIYNADTVYAYLQMQEKGHGNNHKHMAESYYRKYKKAKEGNITQAEYHLKRTITLNPDPEYYKELGSFYNEAKQYYNMRALYEFLYGAYIDDPENKKERKYIFAEAPDEKLFTEFLVSSILAGYVEPWALSEAEGAGYNVERVKNRILNDERLKSDTSQAAYKHMLMSLLTPEEVVKKIKEKDYFLSFLNSIKDSSRAFEIDKQKVQQFNYGDFNTFYPGPDMGLYYAYYLKEKQEEPEKWLVYNFTHRFTINDSVVGVIYAIDTSAKACPKDMRHIYHRLVTFDRNAIMIDNKIVAWQSGEQLGTLNARGNRLEITEHKRSWKKPYVKTEYDNYIVKTEATGTNNYIVLPDGKIQEAVHENVVIITSEAQ